MKKLLVLTVVVLFQLIHAQPPPSSPPPQSSPPASSTTSTTKSSASSSSNPIVTNWITTVTTGYSGYQANVLKIYYDNTYVYISCNSIPSYTIGPWSNPNVAKPQNWTIALPLSPSAASTKKETMMGVIGLWKNGVGIYNAKDGYSWNNQSVWNRNAYYWEYSSFDTAYGHADVSGTYHHHVNPSSMYTASSSSHSPIIGWAWDGYPIYGPFGYSSANNSASSIKRIVPSYKLRSITARTSLYNGTTLSSTYYGPTINSTYPLGSYIEDYEYSMGYGDLDEYCGRYGVTPEYPSGTYAYFVPTNSSGLPAYPYTIGPYFYGSVGSTSLYASIPTSATKYFSYV